MSDAILNVRAYRGLRRLLARTRTRRHVRRALEHLLACAVVLGAVVLGAVLVMDAARFDESVVTAVRGTAYVLGAAVLAVAIASLVARRISDAALAGRIEHAAPELDGRVLAAVEVDVAEAHRAPRVRFDGFSRRTIEQAVDACERSGALGRFERRRIHRATLGSAAVAVLAIAGVLGGPPGWRHGAKLLFAPSQAAMAGIPYRIDVEPGELTMFRGDDGRISAVTVGFTSSDVTLHRRPIGAHEWSTQPMTRVSPAKQTFEQFLFDVAVGFDYFVEASGIRSPQYRAEVRELPQVTAIGLRYVYPPGSGRPPETVSEGGDIRAVEGTRVDLTIETSMPVDAGELLLDEEHAVKLVPAAGALTASVMVEKNARYQIRLPAPLRGMVPASPVYAIFALTDERPWVRFLEPSRDLAVTSIQEVEISLAAHDDVAVSELELVVSVNGAEGEVFSLHDARGPARPEAEGRVVLALEERELAPGDLIAYYARARDRAGDPQREATSDIYFLDVRPFEKRFRRADAGGGGGGGGGGGQAEETLAAQQRELVVALFNMRRDRPRTPPVEFVQQVETAHTGQVRIRERTDAIIRRLGSRRIVSEDPNARRIAEALPKASAKMLEVEALLSVKEVERALPAAREALLQLQRADAAMRDVRVAQSQQRGGGGGGASTGGASAELAKLFQLEMDEFRQQYEDVRRGRWNQGPAEERMDDALRKLQELARRQSMENDRARRRAEQGRGSSAGQEALAQEVEELLRRLERLSRERPSPQLQASIADLQAAMRAMGGANGGGAEALERLRSARARLDADPPHRMAEAIDRVREDSRAIESEHDDTMRELEEAMGDVPAWKREDLSGRHRALAERLRALEPRIGGLAERAREESRDATSRALGDAAQALRRNRTAERLEREGERLREGGEAASGEAIAEDLRQLARHIDTAVDAVGRSSREPFELALEELRDVTRGADGLDRRLRGRPTIAGGARNGFAPTDRDLAGLREALSSQMRGLASRFDQLDMNPGAAGDVSALIDALRQMAQALADDDGESFAERLAALKALERMLREGAPGSTSLVAGGTRTEPSLASREMVERYYRRVGEQSR